MTENVKMENVVFERRLTEILWNTQNPQEIINDLDKWIDEYPLYIKLRLEDKRDHIQYLFDIDKIEAAKKKAEKLLRWMNTFSSSHHFSYFKKDAA